MTKRTLPKLVSDFAKDSEKSVMGAYNTNVAQTSTKKRLAVGKTQGLESEHESSDESSVGSGKRLCMRT